MQNAKSIVMLGATGAVGGCVLAALARAPGIARLTLLGRRPPGVTLPFAVVNHLIDVRQPDSFAVMGAHQDVANCTFGVGQPTKVLRSELVQIDHDAVLAFARACKAAGVQHFQLLSSVGADPASRSFYLRTKGALEEDLRALSFTRLSLFQPSMILTPTNRYGFSQALTLAVWPSLTPLLARGLRRFRGIPVARLGQAFVTNMEISATGTEMLEWDEIMALSKDDGAL